MKIQMEHIPRTIFGVKFNIKCAGGMIMNRFEQFSTKNQQLEAFNKYKSDTEYSDVKMIRWHLNANDDYNYPHDERCEGTMCYCSNRAKKEDPKKWNKYALKSNPNEEILSDTRNTTVESKSLTKDRSIQPMPNRPDVDKALGLDKLSNPDVLALDDVDNSTSKSGRDTLKLKIGRYKKPQIVKFFRS